MVPGAFVLDIEFVPRGATVFASDQGIRVMRDARVLGAVLPASRRKRYRGPNIAEGIQKIALARGVRAKDSGRGEGDVVSRFPRGRRGMVAQGGGEVECVLGMDAPVVGHREAKESHALNLAING